MSARGLRWVIVVVVMLSGAGVWWLRRDTAGSPQRVEWGYLGFSPSPAGSLAALSDELWDVQQRRLVRTGDHFRSNVAWSPDGQMIVTTDRQIGTSIWRAADDTLVQSVPGMPDWRTIAWSADGSLLVSGNEEGVLTLYRLPEDKHPRRLIVSDKIIYTIAISPDSQLIAVVSSDCSVALRRATDGSLVRSIPIGRGCPQTLRFSPDGTILASGNYDGAVNLLRVQDGQLLHRLSDHTGQVNSVAFSPDGQLIATAAGSQFSSGNQPPSDTTVRVWRVADGLPVAVFGGHRRPVSGAMFTPDGRTIVSVGNDDRLRWWPLP